MPSTLLKYHNYSNQIITRTLVCFFLLVSSNNVWNQFSKESVVTKSDASILASAFSTTVCSPSCVRVHSAARTVNTNLKQPSRVLLYAGFGGGSTATNKKSKKKKTKTKPKSVLVEPKDDPPPSEPDLEPKLDRFGLPVLTADNINPPLPPDTELIPSDDVNKYRTQKEINAVLSRHTTVDISQFGNSVRILHVSPPVLAIDGFFSRKECEECFEVVNTSPDDTKDDSNEAGDKNGPMQVNSATFSPLSQSKRTSTTWFCHYHQTPSLLCKAHALLSPACSLPNFEEPQIVRYRTGQEFSWHYDEIPMQQCDNGGQRIATLLVYLNTMNSKYGGGTVFRDLYEYSQIGKSKKKVKKQLTMRPKMGSALLFFPAFRDGTPDDRTLHKGEVAVSKTKMIAQMWIHQGEYSPVIPPGNTKDGVEELMEERRRTIQF